MKTVLFAITMEGFTQAEAFENKVLEALRTGSREFADAAKISCNYKEGLQKLCQQYKPNCLVVNENLTGTGNIYEIIKDIKSEQPDLQITVLIQQQRVVGDATLANLAAAGIYNWIFSPWTVDSIANSLIAPKKMKDVEAYIPKIIDKGDGLAFATKVVEKVEDNLEDLPDVLNSGVNNAVKVKGVSDLEEEKQESTVQYHRVIGRGFGFGSNIKPKKTFDPTKVKEEVKPVQQESSLLTKPQASKEESSLLSKVEASRDEVSSLRKPSIVNEDNIETEQDLEERNRKLMNEILERRKQREAEQQEIMQKRLEEVAHKKQDVPQETLINKAPRPNFQSKIRKTAENLDLSKLDNLGKEATKQEVKQEPKKQEIKKAEPKKEEKPVGLIEDVYPTLEEVEFKPKYKKILFVRALPLTSLIPAHIANLSKAKLVDYNRTDDLYVDALKSSIKEANLFDEEYVIGDVVAGNGVEKLKEKFDYVIGILPEDLAVANMFDKRYPNLCNAVIIDRSCARGRDRKPFLELFKEKMDFISFIRTEDFERKVVQNMLAHKLMMDDSDYSQALKFLVEALGGVHEDSDSDK